MDKKSRVIFGLILLGIAAVGVVIMALAPAIAKALGTQENIPIFTGLGILGILLIALLVKSPKLLSGEMEDKAAKLAAEKDFFVQIPAEETMIGLESKLRGAGFEKKDGMLHKREFSLAKDYVNFYAILAETEDFSTSIKELMQKLDAFSKTSKSLNRNACCLTVFFADKTNEKEFADLKTLMINQRVLLDMQQHWDNAVIPVIYDKENRCFIFYKPKKRSVNPLDLAIRSFCKFACLEK